MEGGMQKEGVSGDDNLCHKCKMASSPNIKQTGKLGPRDGEGSQGLLVIQWLKEVLVGISQSRDGPPCLDQVQVIQVKNPV
jgi:hypothetical protein